jgi:predicted nucleic acid-binding protein
MTSVSAGRERSPEAPGAAIFLDTSVLLEGLIGLQPDGASQRIWTAIAAGRHPSALTAWHCCLEFYSVATRLPEEYRLAPADCQRLLREEILARLAIHDLPARARGPLLDSVAVEGISGGRVYDAHIGEVARLAGASTVVTQNRRHFAALLRHGIRVLTAEEHAAVSSLSR